MRLRQWITGLSLASALTLASAASYAQDTTTYSVDDYIALQTEANAVYETLLSTARSDSDWRSVAREALELRLDLVTYLGDWMRSGTMPQTMQGDAQRTRAYLFQNIAAIYADIDQCDNAATTVSQLTNLVQSIGMGVEGDDLVLEANAGVARCELRLTELADAREEATALGEDTARSVVESTAALVGAVTPLADPLATAPPRQAPRWPIVGAGAALLATGLVFDLTRASQDDRDNVSRCTEDPNDADCHYDDAETTIERIDNGRPITIGLLALGTAGVVTGLVWQRPVPSSSLTLTVRPSPTGVLVTGRF